MPYSVEYQGELATAAALLREAAALTAQPTLKAFLEKRAAGVPLQRLLRQRRGLDGARRRIEPTIGPYEVYEDEWFNYKAAFEAFITVRDDAETEKLQRFAAELQDIENHLPIDPALRNPKLGALAPIAWSTRSSARATPTAACRRRRSTCRTTSASRRRRAPSA